MAAPPQRRIAMDGRVKAAAAAAAADHDARSIEPSSVATFHWIGYSEGGLDTHSHWTDNLGLWRLLAPHELLNLLAQDQRAPRHRLNYLYGTKNDALLSVMYDRNPGARFCPA